MQTMVIVTANGRRRSGTYSEASAAAFGIAPPRPRPAAKRSAVSIVMPLAKAAKTVSRPNQMTLPRSAGRRPMRSPT
jgi:hypothetical protein